MRIFDTHAHIYPDAIALKAAESIGKFYDIPMCESGTVDNLLREGEKAGIEKHLVHSVAVTWERAASINDFIKRSMDAHPDKFIGFGAMHPSHPEMEKELDRVVSLGLHGIKLHPDFQHFHLDDENCIQLFRLMAQRDLALLVHTGDKRYEYSAPVRMARALDKVPKLRAICAHLGGWSVWEDAHKVLAGRDNVWIDTCSSLYALSPEKAAEIIRAYGADRAFFATDYPMWNPKEELERFMALPLTKDEQRAILGENFISFMGDKLK
jgi:Predicted metal-dependent hydrolase of the TIM-barrel fold